MKSKFYCQECFKEVSPEIFCFTYDGKSSSPIDYGNVSFGVKWKCESCGEKNGFCMTVNTKMHVPFTYFDARADIVRELPPNAS